ncbi:TatD family hydrolase [Paenibacillus pinisoli]|nr:TatD family hydrolase [Paenibacillus pinisoli]
MAANMNEVRKSSVIDAHIHLDLYEPAELHPMLEEAFRSGVEAVVAVSMHLASCQANERLARRYPGRVHPAYGFHPEQELPGDDERERLHDWIRVRHERGEAFAIGEVGLPYYMRTEREAAGERFDETRYLEWLESFVKLAAELDRPIVLHAVYEDADKACDLLQRHGVRKAHFHWFKGSAETIARMIASGYYVSITPDAAYEPEIIELVKRYPIGQLMAETDGPWPFEGPYSGRKTIPEMAGYAAADIARIKGMAAEEAEAVLLRNTKTFYGIL